MARTTFLISGCLLGTLLSVLAWHVVGGEFNRSIDARYPSQGSGVPSDESLAANCFTLLVFPVVGTAGGWAGLKFARRCLPESFRNPVRDGLVHAFRDDGTLLTETEFRKGVPHGSYRDFWSHGPVACEGQFVAGVREGPWRYYNKDGSLRETIQFKGGQEVPESQ